MPNINPPIPTAYLDNESPLVVFFDTETFLIRAGRTLPELVCLSYIFQGQGESPGLFVRADREALNAFINEILDPGVILAGWNVGFDMGVLYKYAEDIGNTRWQEKIWEKYHRGEIMDLMVLEKMISLYSLGGIDNVRLRASVDEDGNKVEAKSVRKEYGMAAVLKRRLGVEREKESIKKGQAGETWRLNYNKLVDTPLAEWPQDAIDYAVDDAEDLVAIFADQLNDCADIQDKTDLNPMDTLGFRCAVDFGLKLMSDYGMAVDADLIAPLAEQWNDEYHNKYTKAITAAGILEPAQPPRAHKNNPNKFTKGKSATQKKKPTEDYIRSLCLKHDIPVRETPKGAVSVTKEVLECLSHLGDPVVNDLLQRSILKALVQREVPALMDKDEDGNDVVVDVVHPGFNCLLVTGRTSSFASSSVPSSNMQNKDPRIRKVFASRAGYWLCSTDYSQLELCTTAQRCLDVVGHSVLAEKINAGYDVHSYLGAQLAFNLDADFQSKCTSADPDYLYENFMALASGNKQEEDFWGHYRKFAKPTGLGYPGGLGPATFIALAHRDYKVDVSDAAIHMIADDHEPSNYTKWFYKKNQRKRRWAEEFTWLLEIKAIELAAMLREIWRVAYPEVNEYHTYLKKEMIDNNWSPAADMTEQEKELAEFDEDEVLTAWEQGEFSDEDLAAWERADRKASDVRFHYTSPMGLYRPRCKFTEAANGSSMQAFAGDGANWAGVNLMRECQDPAKSSSPLYGNAMPVAFIHDEYLCEVWADDGKAHERVERIEEIMLDSMKLVCPDVNASVESALMTRWNKKAKTVFDSQGNITLWTPKAEAS